MTEVQFAKQFLTTLDSKNTKYQADHVFDPTTFQMRIPYTLPKLSHPPHPLPPKSTPTTAPIPGSEPSAQHPQSSKIDITLKSNRNPTFTLNLPSLPISTPITLLKSQIQSVLINSGTVPSDKIKILHNKKPVPPSKSTIHDVITTDPSTEAPPPSLEFGVMIMGGAADPTPKDQTIILNHEPEAAGPGSENAAVQAATGVNPEDAMKDVDTTPTMSASEPTAPKEQEQHSEPVQPGESSGKTILETKEFWDDLQGFLEQRLRNAEEAVRLRGLFEQAAK